MNIPSRRYTMILPLPLEKAALAQLGGRRRLLPGMIRRALAKHIGKPELAECDPVGHPREKHARARN